MRQTHFLISLVLVLCISLKSYSQKHSSCPKVLDETVVIYQPPLESIVCEYNELGNCINSFEKAPLLSHRLEYFDTRFRTNGVELIWKEKNNQKGQIFTILRSKDGEQFHKIGTINSSDYEDGQITFLDNLPWLGNNQYILKKVENGKTLISNPQSVYVSMGVCHLETMDIKNQKEDEMVAKYFVDNAGLFQLLVTDTEGNEYTRKNVSLKTGKNKVLLYLPINGIYFVTMTNGFSSVTDLVVQSKGTADQNSTVASDIEKD